MERGFVSRYKILIVDDNKNNLFTLHILLNKLEKCEVIEASGGYEALSKVLSEKIDLIFLDIQMPEIDGFEVAKLFDREYKLKSALKELKNKEGLLIQQSRLAAMGEMISAIAHQWRQPLNVIGLIAQEAEQSYEFGEMDEKAFSQMVNSIMKQLDYMSHTIDDFRDFFKPNKKKEKFNPKVLILEVFNIVSAQLKHHFIDIELNSKDESDIKIYAYAAEFRQVLLNIINNSKDSIIEKQKREDENYKGKISAQSLKDGAKFIIKIKF